MLAETWTDNRFAPRFSQSPRRFLEASEAVFQRIIGQASITAGHDVRRGKKEKELHSSLTGVNA